MANSRSAPLKCDVHMYGHYYSIYTRWLPKRRTLAMRRLALAGIGIGFFVLTGATLGADLRIADPSVVATALGGRQATAHPTEPPAINVRTTAAFVDGLYKELMEWTPPPCLSATSDTSLRGDR